MSLTFRSVETMQPRTSVRRSWWTDGQLLSRQKGTTPLKACYIVTPFKASYIVTPFKACYIVTPLKAWIQTVIPIQTSWPALPRAPSLPWWRRPCDLPSKTGWKGGLSSEPYFAQLYKAINNNEAYRCTGRYGVAISERRIKCTLTPRRAYAV